MVLISSIYFIKFGIDLQVQTMLTFFTSLYLSLSLGCWGYFSAKGRSKTSSWWEDKEKSKSSEIICSIGF
jgi:hypothetical protein